MSTAVVVVVRNTMGYRRLSVWARLVKHSRRRAADRGDRRAPHPAIGRIAHRHPGLDEGRGVAL